jgi:SAM-dependent methyltransferase
MAGMYHCPSAAELAERLEDWFASALGAELAAEEESCLENMLRDTFGYYMLQVGLNAGFAEAVGSSRIRHRILLPPSACCDLLGLQITALPEQLPIAADSVDAVFLPHTLDFASDPHQVLREAERVLIPEGRVVVIGFNALSLWGLWRLVPRRRGRVPWCGTFLNPYRVTDWLSLLGFDVEMQEMMMFRPPWRRTLPRQLSFLGSLGGRYRTVLGGVYAIRAVKRVSTLTPLRPSWKMRGKLIPGGAVEPTARGRMSHVATPSAVQLGIPIRDSIGPMKSPDSQHV